MSHTHKHVQTSIKRGENGKDRYKTQRVTDCLFVLFYYYHVLLIANPVNTLLVIKQIQMKAFFFVPQW